MNNDYSKEIDPVCGMHVDPDTSSFQHEHGGDRYYFCTSVCRDEFMQHPERFLIEENDSAVRYSEGEAGTRRQSGPASAVRARGPSQPSRPQESQGSGRQST